MKCKKCGNAEPTKFLVQVRAILNYEVTRVRKGHILYNDEGDAWEAEDSITTNTLICGKCGKRQETKLNFDTDGYWWNDEDN